MTKKQFIGASRHFNVSAPEADKLILCLIISAMLDVFAAVSHLKMKAAEKVKNIIYPVSGKIKICKLFYTLRIMSVKILIRRKILSRLNLIMKILEFISYFLLFWVLPYFALIMF
ncbi:MAG: hypothetical protein IJ689_04180 [Alphaproteobacteria bacterium]|nr:hypothetical protein [Alphaproteobacteria bacterium]